MALINCPECNEEVSDKANSCPKCGYGFDIIALEKTIQENKKTPCSSDLEAKMNILDNYKKTLKYLIYIIGIFSLAMFILMATVSSSFFTVLIIGLFIGIFYGAYIDSKYTKAKLNILPCLKSVFLNISTDEVNDNFDSIENNKTFTNTKIDLATYEAYAYAYKLNADAILFEATTQDDLDFNHIVSYLKLKK